MEVLDKMDDHVKWPSFWGGSLLEFTYSNVGIEYEFSKDFF